MPVNTLGRIAQTLRGGTHERIAVTACVFPTPKSQLCCKDACAMGISPSLLSSLRLCLARPRQTGLLLALLTTTTLASGCQGMLQGFAPDLGETAVAETNSDGIYIIEVRSGGGKPDTETLALSEGMTINQALEQAGVTKRRGDWDIELIRTNPDSGMRHKMNVSYDAKERRVPIEQDYAIYPNDHLVVNQIASNPLGDMFGNLFGP